MKLRTLASALLLVLAVMNLTAADYPGSLKKRIKKALGPDFDNYEWLSYPTNNFGIATAFVLMQANEKPGPTNQLCATFTCLGLEDSQPPADSKLFLTANGYADIGVGGSLELTDKEKSNLTIGVGLPQVFRALGINITIGKEKLVSTTVILGHAYKRFLNHHKMLTYIRGLPSNVPLRRAFENRHLALVIADAVVESMEFEVKLNKSVTTDIQAKLDEKINRVVGEGTNLQVKVSKVGDAEYHFKITQPVIVCRLTAKQPLFEELPVDSGGKTDSKVGLRLFGPELQRYSKYPALKDWAYWVPTKSIK